MARRLTAAILLVVLVPACSLSRARRDSAADADQVFKDCGGGLSEACPTTTVLPAEAEPAEAPKSPPTDGTLVLTVVDQNGNGAGGIPVVINGPVSQSAVTDAGGAIRLTVPAGDYEFGIQAGCHENLIVEFGESGNALLAGGDETSGRLSVVWKGRVAPGEGAYPSTGPHWDVGKLIDIQYDVVERCGPSLARNASFTTFALKPSGNIEIVQPPRFSSDGHARDYLQLRCRSGGAANLVIYDQRNPSDETDIVDWMFDASLERMQCR